MMREIEGAMARTVSGGFEITFETKGYVWYDDPYRLNIIGVRSPAKRAGKFDDACWVIWKDDEPPADDDDGAAGTHVLVYDITCDPGPKYLKRPINRAGCAILASGQYVDTYKLGRHQGKYPALVQRGGPVRVYRDDNRDGFLDHEPESRMKGWYGINLHHAKGEYDFGASFKGASAGCQVWASKSAFEHFIGLCRKHKKLYGNSFTYTLLPEHGPLQ